MPCNPIIGPDGKQVGIACSRGKMCSVAGCERTAHYLCDFPLRGKKAGQTCDAPICIVHRIPFDELDYCPPHHRMVSPGG